MEIVFRSLSEQQLLDLAGLKSFAGNRGLIIDELQRRGNGLSPTAFRLAFPGCQEVATEKCVWGYDCDGIPVGMPIYRLVANDESGVEVHSQTYI